MSDLVDLLGADHAQRLADVAGGTRLFIPKHFGRPPSGGRDTSERLIALVGEPLAILLVFHFGDSLLYVPRGKPAARFDVDRFKRLNRKGLSQREIARLLGCSERTIEKRRAKDRTNGSRKARKERRA